MNKLRFKKWPNLLNVTHYIGSNRTGTHTQGWPAPKSGLITTQYNWGCTIQPPKTTILKGRPPYLSFTQTSVHQSLSIFLEPFLLLLLTGNHGRAMKVSFWNNSFPGDSLEGYLSPCSPTTSISRGPCPILSSNTSCISLFWRAACRNAGPEL